MTEHPIQQQISEIDVYACGEELQYFKVGRNDVSRIEACTKPGLHCDIPYVRVWADGHCVAEFCQHNIVGVYFAPNPPASDAPPASSQQASGVEAAAGQHSDGSPL